MKKLISIVLCLTLAFSLAVPVFAAEKPDIETRIANIKKTYGVVVTYEPSVKNQVPQHLDVLEDALNFLGKVFVKKIVQTNKEWRQASNLDDMPFSVHIAPRIKVDPNSTMAGLGLENRSATGNSGGIELYVWEPMQLTVKTLVHEFGHSFDFQNNFYNDVEKMNGGAASYWKAVNAYNQNRTLDTSRYVSVYAMSSAQEDFAETFANMILNGGNSPTTLGKDTLLYKKYTYIYGMLKDKIGEKSRVTQRAGEFLGKK